MFELVLVTLGVASSFGVASGFSRSSEIAHDAIVEAVRSRMGAGVEVVVNDLVVTGTIAAAAARAIPEPDARLGAVIRFTLQSADGTTPLGSATARISAIVPHMHAVLPLERGADIAADEVAAVAHVVSAGPMRPWPGAAATVGSKLLQPLATGACVSRQSIQAVQAVRVGQDVTAIAHIGGVEARAVMVAAGSGDAGAVIRVVNRQSRRALKARVVSAGIVEIIK
jgi:flagella basal body P-ring formation protein FlgA